MAIKMTLTKQVTEYGITLMGAPQMPGAWIVREWTDGFTTIEAEGNPNLYQKFSGSTMFRALDDFREYMGVETVG